MSGEKAMGHTPGPWRLVIDDTGGEMSGWPLCVTASDNEDKMIVRTGGQWPYKWDEYTSRAEAIANARLIAAAPDLLSAAEEVLADLSERIAQARKAKEPLPVFRGIADLGDAINAAKQGEE